MIVDSLVSLSTPPAPTYVTPNFCNSVLGGERHNVFSERAGGLRIANCTSVVNNYCRGDKCHLSKTPNPISVVYRPPHTSTQANRCRSVCVGTAINACQSGN